MRTTSIQRDANNNITSWTDTDQTRPSGNQTSSASMTYDDANRKLSETVSYPTGNTLSYSYAYSPAGKKTQLTWADGTQIAYSYSQNGEVETITIPNEGTLSVNQFKWRAPVKTTLPGGSTQERSLDGLLNLEALKVKTAGQQVTLSVSNSFGKLQELKQNTRTDTVNNNSSTKSNSYTYDNALRLTKATSDSGGLFGTDTERFTLDSVSNRILHSKQSGAWTYDPNNRLTQRGTDSNAVNYTYDDAGNLIKKTEPGNKITQYSYDGNNRLVAVNDGQNKLIARYGYDPMNRRIWKEQYRTIDGASLNPAKRTSNLYADEGLIAEATQDITLNADQTTTLSGSATITTQYGPKPDNGFMTGILFIKTKNSAGQDSIAYYHNDHLPTPMQATDKAGNVVWSASYTPFGRATITTPTATADKATITSNLRFPGQYEDQETGLHYNYNRYYDPQTGRYVTSDPIGLSGGINTYSYVNGNPVSFGDPFGLDATILINTTGGRSRWDGPTNGSWGGKCWSGGAYACNGHPDGNAPPKDSGDACYMAHDKCYEQPSCNSSDPSKNKKGVRSCDIELVRCLETLPDDPRKWPNSPKPGTEKDSDDYKKWAKMYFK